MLSIFGINDQTSWAITASIGHQNSLAEYSTRILFCYKILLLVSKLSKHILLEAETYSSHIFCYTTDFHLVSNRSKTNKKKFRKTTKKSKTKST